MAMSPADTRASDKSANEGARVSRWHSALSRLCTAQVGRLEPRSGVITRRGWSLRSAPETLAHHYPVVLHNRYLGLLYFSSDVDH
jgi:hypothetical protein